MPDSLRSCCERDLAHPLVIFAARRRVRRGQGLAPTAVGRIRLTTLPTDIDILRHMNNGRYLSLFDLGRWIC